MAAQKHHCLRVAAALKSSACDMQVHVDEWKVEVQEADKAQPLLKQQQEAPPVSNVAR